MDPKANLREMLRLARLLYPDREEDQITDAQVLVDNGARLAELILALDQWMRQGGFSPWHEVRNG